MSLIEEPKNPLEKENREVFGYGILVGMALAFLVVVALQLIQPHNVPQRNQVEASQTCSTPWWGLGFYVECK